MALTRHVRLSRKTRLAPANPERRARRKKRFQAFFSTAFWRAFRERVFQRDGYRCVRTIDGVRCPNGRESGARLVCNHTTYARFGGRELLDDCETLCAPCDRIETTAHRANWSAERRCAQQQPRRGSFTSLTA